MRNRIKELRINAGLTQQDLADAIGVQAQTIARLEKGQRKLDQMRMEQIARALNIRTSELLPADGGDASLAASSAGPGHSIETRRDDFDVARAVFNVAQQLLPDPAITFEDIVRLQRLCAEIAAFVPEK